jgi:hypothetical protein
MMTTNWTDETVALIMPFSAGSGAAVLHQSPGEFSDVCLSVLIAHLDGVFTL